MVILVLILISGRPIAQTGCIHSRGSSKDRLPHCSTLAISTSKTGWFIIVSFRDASNSIHEHGLLM